MSVTKCSCPINIYNGKFVADGSSNINRKPFMTFANKLINTVDNHS